MLGSMGIPEPSGGGSSHHVGSAAADGGAALGAPPVGVAEGAGLGCEHVDVAAAMEPPVRATTEMHPAGSRMTPTMPAAKTGRENRFTPTQPREDLRCLATLFCGPSVGIAVEPVDIVCEGMAPGEDVSHVEEVPN